MCVCILCVSEYKREIKSDFLLDQSINKSHFYDEWKKVKVK